MSDNLDQKLELSFEEVQSRYERLSTEAEEIMNGPLNNLRRERIMRCRRQLSSLLKQGAVKKELRKKEYYELGETLHYRIAFTRREIGRYLDNRR